MNVTDLLSFEAKNQFLNSLKNTGFATLYNHNINIESLSKMQDSWYNFFQEEDKVFYEYDEVKHDGFVSFEKSETAKNNDKKDLKEFYHYYPNGRCPQGLKKITQQIYDELYSLSSMLLSWIQEDIQDNIENFDKIPLIKSIKNSPNTLLRIIHYPPMQNMLPTLSTRAAAHTDINLITLIPFASSRGLQIKYNDVWFDMPCDSKYITVNSGDMLSEYTNQYFKSTVHRVINPQNEETNISRLSTAFFLHPNDNIVLSDKYTAGSFKTERLKELGLL